jgi:hypothetical protein
MTALGPSLFAEIGREVTVTEIREWNVTDVMTNVSVDFCQLQLFTQKCPHKTR